MKVAAARAARFRVEMPLGSKYDAPVVRYIDIAQSIYPSYSTYLHSQERRLDKARTVHERMYEGTKVHVFTILWSE